MIGLRAIKKRVRFVAVIFLVVLVFTCGRNDEGGSRRPLRFAFQNRVGSAIPIVAFEKGFFGKEGISVEPLQFNNGPACAEALFSGSADLGAMGDSTALTALVQHPELRLIASHGSGEHRHRLIVLESFEDRSPRSLIGKRVGLKKGTSTHGGFLAFLAANGVQKETVTLVDLNPGTMPEALAAGSVDAIAASEPTPSLAEAMGGHELATFGGLGNLYPILILTHKSVLSERKEDLNKLFRSLKRAEDYVIANPYETARLLSRATGLSLPVTQKAMHRHRYRLCLDETVLSSLRATARFLMNQKRLPAMPDFEKALSLQVMIDIEINPQTTDRK